MKMGDYVDLAADLYGLPRPPRLPRSTAQAALPLGREVGAALCGQAGLGVEPGTQGRAHHGQGLQTAHPGEQAGGVVELQAAVALAGAVGQQALPLRLCTGHLQGELAATRALYANGGSGAVAI